MDYVKIHYGEFNSFVMRGLRKRDDQFYEYATISVVEDESRFRIYSRSVTLLDSKGEVIRELVEERE